MSLVFKTEKTILVSHEKYLNQVYSNQENIELNYKVNPLLFNINSAYLRKNQIKISKKRKKNINLNNEETNIISNVELEYNDFIKKCNLFSNNDKNFIEDNNKLSTDFIQEFYDNSASFDSTVIKGENPLHYSVITKLNNDQFIIPSACKFFNNNVSEIESLLKNQKYDLIVIDPPWWNKYIRRVKSLNKISSYSMMENDDILNIPLENFIKLNSLVVIWCTNSNSVLESIEKKFMKKWKLKLVTTWFWLKVTNFGKPICEFRQPNCKQPFERIIIGCHEDSDLEVFNDIKKTELIISVPSAVHSNKPPLIEILKPYLPESPSCLEIFARNLVPGFTSIGLEVLKLQNIKLFEQISF